MLSCTTDICKLYLYIEKERTQYRFDKTFVNCQKGSFTLNYQVNTGRKGKGYGRKRLEMLLDKLFLAIWEGNECVWCPIAYALLLPKMLMYQKCPYEFKCVDLKSKFLNFNDFYVKSYVIYATDTNHHIS